MESGYEVVGLVADVVPPVYSSFVPTPVGVTVLYGLNGAGKTKLLSALRSCLEGEEGLDGGDSDVLVRVSYGDDPEDHPDWLCHYAAGWADQAETAWTPSTIAPELLVHPRDLVARGVRDSLDNAEGWADRPPGPQLDLDQLSREIAEQGTFLLGVGIAGQFVARTGAMALDGTELIGSAARKLHAFHLASRGAPGSSDSVSELADPFHNEFALGPPFQSVLDAASHLPPLIDVVHSDKEIASRRVASVIADDSHLPPVGDLFNALSTGGPKLNGKGALSKKGSHFLEGVESLAQSLLDTVLLDAPRICISLGNPREWMLGRPPKWVARDRGRSDRTIEIHRLSRAECRWATLSIVLATQLTMDDAWEKRYGSKRDPLFIVLDEPEAALHRSAEAFMARGLVKWASALNCHVVVASHSPELLDLPDGNILSVMRNSEGRSSVRPLSPPTKETMAEFGLRPSDLLRRQRGFLLVEGTHDQIVLEELVGDELQDCRVDIIPLRGAKQLPVTVDSQFLFDYTDAHVIVMLDAMDADKVRRVWQEAAALATAGDPDRAGHSLREALNGNSAEIRWMREFLSKSIDRGVHDRLTPFGLRALDVIDYLPVVKLVPRSSSWESLRAEHGAAGTSKDFKSWLVGAKRASFTPDRIREAARSLDSVPSELVALVNLCRELPAL